MVRRGADHTVELHDIAPDVDEFRRDVLQGLRSSPKVLWCKYLYDERGSTLFDEICELDEYYLTRAELEIMRRHAQAMASSLGEKCLLVEYGSGSSVKTPLLLEHMITPAGYVPLDISREHLAKSAAAIAREFSHIEVLPLCADYTQPMELPQPALTPASKAVYFPGSTIGNFHPDAAEELLRGIADLCGAGGSLLIGVDLRKDRRILEAAYNDSEGITAEFNLNLLRRINRELDGDIDIEQFDFRAVWNTRRGRIESYLLSRCDQTVRIGDDELEFSEGERVRTECSYKYDRSGFAELAGRAGFEVSHIWTDRHERFSVQHLVVRPPAAPATAE
jgi:dimethylhistidine N-methyltransferase